MHSDLIHLKKNYNLKSLAFINTPNFNLTNYTGPIPTFDSNALLTKMKEQALYLVCMFLYLFIIEFSSLNLNCL